MIKLNIAVVLVIATMASIPAPAVADTTQVLDLEATLQRQTDAYTRHQHELQGLVKLKKKAMSALKRANNSEAGSTGQHFQLGLYAKLQAEVLHKGVEAIAKLRRTDQSILTTLHRLKAAVAERGRRASSQLDSHSPSYRRAVSTLLGDVELIKALGNDPAITARPGWGGLLMLQHKILLALRREMSGRHANQAHSYAKLQEVFEDQAALLRLKLEAFRSEAQQLQGLVIANSSAEVLAHAQKVASRVDLMLNDEEAQKAQKQTERLLDKLDGESVNVGVGLSDAASDSGIKTWLHQLQHGAETR